MSYAQQTDHFSLAGTDLILIESSKTPVAESRAEARDENNDIAAATWYGNDAGTLFKASCTYLLKSGTLNLNTLDLGEISAGTVIESINVETTQGGHPRITVDGTLGAETITSPSGLENTFSLPDITVTAIKAAQALGFTVSEGKLTSCSLSASCELSQEDDGDGEPVAHGVSGAVGTVSASFVAVTTAPSWTLTLSGLTESQAPTTESPQAAYGTSSATAEFIIARDVTP